MKEKLFTLINEMLSQEKEFDNFCSEFNGLYWGEEGKEGLDEIEGDFLYRIYECSTYVTDSDEAGKYGLRTLEEFMAWLKRNFEEYTENKENWFKRVSESKEMWI